MRKAGDVVFADVEKDRGKSTGVVEFASYSEMKNAIRKLDNTDLNGNTIYLKEVRSTHFSLCFVCSWLVPLGSSRRNRGLALG
jgi:RNA recognition motif-containing protein